MAPTLTKVVYQPDSRESTAFHVIVNSAEYARWKGGETSIPLVEVVDSFQVFSTQQGAQGLLGKASKQELENAFGTSRDDDVVKIILEKGKSETTDAIRSSDWGTKNAGKGSFIDNRGTGRGTTGV
ncbi:ribosome maturation protein [Vararia minispora EC-137]|uniref:Ribosome maturation protein n=1 Tax=Vararia minispora EC-137 TaxID=1314806 RepID=A0ACB8Q995_9AGAM|nr:ribosome maturation protein [Vararia minispora EC-137]